MADEVFVSLSPDDYAQGGFLDDVSGTVKRAYYTAGWDYGQTRTPVLALVLEVERDDGHPVTQPYTLGNTPLKPTADGRYLTGSGRIPVNSNAGKLGKALVEAGFPADKLATGDASALVGMRAFWRTRVDTFKAKDGTEHKTSVSLPMTIHSLPGETADADDGVAEFVHAVIAQNSGNVSLSDLVNAVFSDAGSGLADKSKIAASLSTWADGQPIDGVRVANGVVSLA